MDKKIIKNYFLIFTVSLFLFFVGALFGFIFFYFFKQQSVFIIDKFKLLQSIFGIREYQEGMSFIYLFSVIFLGNLFSIIGYFALGYFKALIPVSVISGFFIIIFLFSGTIRHGTPLPGEVILLSSMEMFYRIMTISLGEYIQKCKFKNKILVIILIALIILIFAGAVFYEIIILY